MVRKELFSGLVFYALSDSEGRFHIHSISPGTRSTSNAAVFKLGLLMPYACIWHVETLKL